MVEPLNTKAWVLVKRGAYWRPDAQGYTYFKTEAGRYSDEEAASYVEHGGSNGTTSKIRWDDAPELSPGCTDEAARRFYASRVLYLEEALRKIADIAHRNFGRQNEKLADIEPIARNALSGEKP